MNRLYPPNILQELPSLYEGADLLSVPFSVNKTVSPASVRGISARIKTTNTDTLIATLYTENILVNANENFQTALFSTQALQNKMSIGRFYKVQIAYVDVNGKEGYYSTLGILKYTSKPYLSIADCNIAITNTNLKEYIGIYQNNDTSEKVYEYKFTVYDASDRVIETSGWKLHNTYSDEKSNESVNRYFIKYSLDYNTIYRIQYSIRTNNHLELSTPKYRIMQADTINPELNVKVNASLDYENANIKVTLQAPYVNGREESASGEFIVARTSSDTNFKIWTIVNKFKLMAQPPSTYEFIDYAIEHGVTYQYALQQYNRADIYSNKIYSNFIKAEFEDIYLYDGQKQIRIQYNPQIASFKTNYLDTKKTTLGSQYPFIFRNGAVAYKEFPINGLISYSLDQNYTFISKQDLGMPDNWEFITDITNENIAYERRFKLALLDWLNDGNIKLFKSPTEGNYLVRLTNVSLTPVQQLARMLHNFSCTASEVAECTLDNLATYKFINIDTNPISSMRWRSIKLSDIYKNAQSQVKNTNDYDAINKIISQIDIFENKNCYYLQIYGVVPGTHFTLGNIDIEIGVTGSYEVSLETPVRGLYLTSNIPQNGIGDGIITYGVYTTASNKFDRINKISTYDVLLAQYYGEHQNILSDYRDLKHSITRMYFSRFSPLGVEIVPNLETLEYAIARQGTLGDAFVPNKIYQARDTGIYYKIITKVVKEESANTAEEDSITNYYYAQEARPLWHNNENGEVVYDTYEPIVRFGHYDVDINNEPIFVVEQEFSLVEENDVFIPDLDYVPEVIWIGNGVCAEISLQIKVIEYGVEEALLNARNAYDEAYETWRAYCLNYALLNRANNAHNILLTSNDVVVFKFEHNMFIAIPLAERKDIPASTRVWIGKEQLSNQGEEPYWSEEEVQGAYNTYKAAQTEFMDALAIALREQEEDLTQ